VRRWAWWRQEAPAIPPGLRVYAIGDIHGEAELFLMLLKNIAADKKASSATEIILVLLGDLIDRGPRSATVLSAVMNADEDAIEQIGDGFQKLVVLRGNHEQTFIDAYNGDDRALMFWLQYGGRETLESFGIRDLDQPPAELRAQMHARIAPAIPDRMERWPTSFEVGDYFFVHAGIQPGVALKDQCEYDLLWIRDEFTGSARRHDKIIVHGHTIEPAPVRLGGNRICLDTGAHEYGRLTALALENDQQWVVEAARPVETSDS